MDSDEPLAMNTQGAAVLYNVVGLGSVVSLAEGTGAITNTYTYDAFGKRTNTIGTLFKGIGVRRRIRAIGERAQSL